MPKPDSLKQQFGGDHYKGMAIEPVEYIFRNRIPFLEGNAIKYLSRHSDKGREQDVLKAMHFCRMILEMEYGVLVDVRRKDSGSECEQVRRETDDVSTGLSCNYSQGAADSPGVLQELDEQSGDSNGQVGP